MTETYSKLRKKEYSKKSFKDLQAEAFCDLLNVVLPKSKLPAKVKEFKGVIDTIKTTYPNPKTEVEKAKGFLSLIIKLFRKAF